MTVGSALFQDIYNKTVIETNRPDLIQDTQQAITSATQAAHAIGGEFFAKDISTADLMFDAPGGVGSYIVEFSTAALPRFRALSYFRKWDPSYNASQLNPSVQPPFYNVVGMPITANLALHPLELITPTSILDDYNLERLDVFYQAGSTIFIKSSTPLAAGKIGWYSWPFIDSINNFTNYESWVAREFPFVIVYMAAANVLSKTGMNDAAKDYTRPAGNNGRLDSGGLLTQQLLMLVNSNITAMGY